MIAISALQHAYGTQEVLNIAQWNVAAGQHSLVLGPSGCGKSTLFNLLAGLISLQTGDISIQGTSLRNLKAAERDPFRAKHIGFVMQRLHLISALNVRHNLRLTQRLGGFETDDARIDALLESLDLASKADAKPRTLSVGESQRVAVARAVINRPPLILADEPTSALDDSNCEAALNLLMQQADQHGATLVIATHDQRIKSRFSNVLQLQKPMTMDSHHA